MNRIVIIAFTFFYIFISDIRGASLFENEISTIYEETGIAKKLDLEIFRLSMIGFNNLKQLNEFQDISVITIIDFSKPSTEERLFVIDLEKKEVLYSSLVAHGKNSGWNFANKFSNVSGSLMSSLGFFRTSDTYVGKHGYSLRLEGLESSFNGKAEDRAIVIHKARYVSEGFIKKYGRLGRSWGCPALPVDSAKTIIDEIKSGTCLFIYADDDNYLKNSELLKQFSDYSEE